MVKELKVGESYTGDELVDILGEGEKFVDERLYAMGTDDTRLVLADEGNDNYKVLDIIKETPLEAVKCLYGRDSYYLEMMLREAVAKRECARLLLERILGRKVDDNESQKV